MAGRLTKEQIISNVYYDVEECGVGWEELEKSSEADNCVQLNPQHTPDKLCNSSAILLTFGSPSPRD